MVRKQKGFTVVELMISVSIFSVVTLIVSMGVIYIGRSYKQGTERSRLLDASRQIHEQFTQAIEYSSSTSPLPVSESITVGARTYKVWCAGTTRFAWAESSGSTVYKYSSTNGGSLYTDQVAGVDSCAVTAFNPGSAKQLLPADGFVTDFTPTSVGGNMSALSTRFAIGQSDMFMPTGAFPSGDVSQPCQSIRISGTELCSVVQYKSTVLRKVGL